MRRPRFVIEGDGSQASRRDFGLIALGVLLGLAVAALWFESREDDLSGGAGLQPSAAMKDPLAAEFARCQSLGEAGARDDACLRVWANNRRRFIKPSAQSVAPEPPVPSAPLKNQDRIPAAQPDQPSADIRKGR